MAMQLVKPAAEYLPSYVDALQRGWSPASVRSAEIAREHRDAIADNAAAFVDSLDDPQARGKPITLPDGTQVPRLPGFIRWMWGGEFCGSIQLRWQNGTSELPPHVLGHIGYTVVPWKHRLGYATRALGLLLPEARAVGLDYVEITTDADNLPSQKVVTANGGVLVERFHKLPVYGGGESLRFRIAL